MDAKKYKQQLLDKLYKPYLQCVKCPLGSLGRKQVVFGRGNPDARIMFIGEGPGKEEDEQGKPFVGRSGKLLSRVLDIVAINTEDIFITNIVKCRPPSNRKPTAQESSICKRLLLVHQIKIIRPTIICTLGATAAQELLDEEIKISKIRGTIRKKYDTLIIPTYHPAYILRNPKKLNTFVSDIQKILDLSSKQ